jgi:hypothetical protein
VNAGETLAPVAWRAAVGEAQSTRLFLRVLNSEEPALSQHIADHIITDDAHLAALLDFVTRPISRPTHAGAAWIGQFAVDVSGVRGAAAPVGASDAATDSDAASSVAHQSRSAAHLRPDSDAAGSLEQRFSSYSILHAAPPLLATPGGGGVLEVHAPPLDDFSADLAALKYSSDGETDSVASSSFGLASGGGGASNSHAIPGAVIAAHAASFSAAVADVRYSASAAARSWRGRSGAPLATSRSSEGFEVSGADHGTSAVTQGDPGGAAEPVALRPVSLLFPRQGEEISALNELLDAAASDTSALGGAMAALSMQSTPSRLLSAPQAEGTTDASATDALSGGGGSSAAPPPRSPSKRGVPSDALRAPTPAEISRAIALEHAAVKRSFRAMRLLCANNEIADDILESHTADVTKHLFGAFSARCKGSLYHVCSLLQRLIQVRGLERVVLSSA